MSKLITKDDLKSVIDKVIPLRADTTINRITLPYTPPCNGIFFGMLRAAATGRAYKQFSNAEPSLWDFYQTADGYSTFASFVQAGIEIAETATANISETPYYFFVPLDGSTPLYTERTDAVDCIIEQGTSGDTSYRKWNSGVAECWISTTQNVALNNAYGSLYQGTWDWYFPVTFLDAPTVTCSCFKWGTGASWGTVAGVSGNGVTLRGIDAVSRASGSCTISAYAIGKWK